VRLLISLFLLVQPAILAAQGAGTISPGMSRAKVVSVLGAPTTERTVSEFRYLFYQNSCGKACGMNDLVILRNDSVVDAIFRSPSRHYTGTSSSPAPISAKDAADRAPKSGGGTKSTSRATVRMKPPREANDARPSIPNDKPTLAPAPASQPSTKTP
jgi:outer membrane protein assembly factor BamE (lipoprotein component of BamABCDE complex)